MEKGTPFKLPKSTRTRCKKKSATSGNHPATDASPGYDVPSDSDEIDCNLDLQSSDTQSTISAEDADSSGSDGEETAPQSTAESPPASEETTERPPPVSEEDTLAAGLRASGTETLPHSTTTKAAAVAMIMALVASEGVSWKGLDNLLLMVNAFFHPEPAVLPQSKYLFRKLWAAETESAAAYHFYCRSCNDLLEVAEDDGICPTCETSNKLKNVKKDGDFFVVLDIGKQLNHIIQMNKPALHEKLSGVARDREGDASVISDITEAEAYVKLQSSGTLQGSDLTLTVNTDGSPVFTSSGASVWPIQFTVNELPVPQRFKVSALAGLWFGRGHPNMTLFLGKFVEGVTTMEPVLWQHEGTRHSSRAYVLCCCVDAPARSSVQNIVLFNGYYGCPWCLIKGDYIDGSLRFLSFDDAPERTSAGVLRDMKLALEMSMVINGYKGPSPAVNLPHFDLVWGFTVEYMHAVLLGVTRQITELLLSSANSSERYYIDALLRAFVASTATLYKDQAMTFNIHQLLHLAEAARQMGPLWGHSAFVFESGARDSFTGPDTMHLNGFPG
ncbi:hypothetical protein IscW_ISCW009683 [Ixodes scapularis]|uniref:Cr1-8 nvi n=1 Tax=Ixodes scapularis TaxID=6945 RepID=B7PXF7_IXOSC|nr:hypothetical protein IscW_ISCW009683 [Ixodes scapularis]|eukprot:XP_002400468.1 hypothetical protein IscW_ISCW009683 [Ixodes scapularis]